MGGLFGETPDSQWSMHIDESIDLIPVRTSQRAELLAAIEGVRRLSEYWLPKMNTRDIGENGRLAQMVVATDSDYVCKAMTEWMPKWKVRR
jgi:ribonuclease HI